MSDKPLPKGPSINPESAPFWAAAGEGQLLIGHCAACMQPHYYPRRHCPYCGSDRIKWMAAKGTGEIYTFVNVARGPAGPFTMAYVRLDEGVSLITHIVDADPAGLAIGQRVMLRFMPSDGGPPYPVFAPVREDHDR